MSTGHVCRAGGDLRAEILAFDVEVHRGGRALLDQSRGNWPPLRPLMEVRERGLPILERSMCSFALAGAVLEGRAGQQQERKREGYC